MTTTERARNRRRHRLLLAAALVTVGSAACDDTPEPPAAASTPTYDGEGATSTSTETPDSLSPVSSSSRHPARRPTPTPVPTTQPHLRSENRKSDGIPGVWLRLAHCESTSRWHIRNPPYSGGLQFTGSTWSAYRLRGHPRSAWQAAPAQQVVVGKRVLRAQGPGAWPHCSVVVGLTMRDAA